MRGGAYPSFTRWDRIDPDADGFAPPVALADVRVDLGLFDDTSDDDTILAKLLAADEEVALVLGQPVATRGVVDYFGGWSGKLMLTGPGVGSGSSVAVTYIDADGDAQTLDADLVTLDADGVEAALSIDDSAFSLALSSKVRAPVRASYMAGLQSAFRGYRVALEAIRLRTRQLYNAAGPNGEIPDDRPIRKMLEPFARLPWRPRPQFDGG